VGKSIKKVVMLDVGGVIAPDSHIGAYNQKELEILTGLTADELNAFQDHTALNLGTKTLTEVFDLISQHAKRDPKPTTAELLVAYERGVSFYPNAVEMIRALYSAGYQVCLLTNNSHEGIKHVRNLLRAEKLSYVKVYGSAEIGLSKPNPEMFLHACTTENVSSNECWFVDDRSENRDVAKLLGMSVAPVNRPETLADTTETINACRDTFLTLGVLRDTKILFPENFNRGKYPSLLGLFHNEVVQYNPKSQAFNTLDQPNADGNQEKRCLYESRLFELIVKSGSDYWKSAYHKINQLFLADFDRKNNACFGDTYTKYFLQIEKILKNEGVLLEKERSHSTLELRDSLKSLYSKDPFPLTTISQLYYGVWLLDYGHQPLEPFVFLVNGNPSVSGEQILMLTFFPDMAYNPESRADAYLLAQNWVTCGTPQLRGRHSRENAPKPASSSTIGIVRDDDPNAKTLQTAPHYAAKASFAPAREHPIAQALQAMGAPIIGGSSGTLGRNIYMLAPLISHGLLTQKELMQYVMGFTADLVYRGHHSFEEIAIVADKILFPLKPWLDPIRDPINFYEQLLTPEFCMSKQYQAFKETHEHFFDTPINHSLRIS
jgi:HAD superfamily hydrolase (TIGR01509 family)